MSERQSHGFSFQNTIIEKFNLLPDNSYTGKWDAYTKSGIPISIKVAKFGTDVEMADLYRNININQDFILIVGFWSLQKTNIVETHYLFLPYKEWISFFSEKIGQDLKAFLANITNSSIDDEKWKKGISIYKKLWGKETPNLVRLRFKRDHKT